MEKDDVLQLTFDDIDLATVLTTSDIQKIGYLTNEIEMIVNKVDLTAHVILKKDNNHRGSL